ncbi:hypothetical protein [Streptomyces sp. NPDC002044]|uniref:hypothetical protein n=1 Tax=Streptomyces sp. NPDC002044 TaxID=3154662 RepID=UPI00331AD657
MPADPGAGPGPGPGRRAERHVLILGGTTEARRLAQALAGTPAGPAPGGGAAGPAGAGR